MSFKTGTNGTITTVPLNLSVGGAAAAVKVTQAATSSLLPSYLPITHANGGLHSAGITFPSSCILLASQSCCT